MKAQRASATSIFEDLGFSTREAANLRLRAAMMDALIDEIEKRGISQAQVAKRMGITQPRVSDLMRGKLHLFSIDTLITLLAAMGLTVDLRIRRAA